VKLRATILQTGKTAAGIRIPAAVVTALGGSKRPAVRVTINGYTYRTSIATMGGNYMLPVSVQVRREAGVAGGDEVELQLELDTAPRKVEVSKDLAKALSGSRKAKAFFEGLAYSYQRWYVLWIESAKKVETRNARLAKAVTMLAEGKKQG
jgi:antitoxin component of MazEF toxin-antitoxin module